MQPVKSVVKRDQNVVEIVRVAGRLFVLRHVGGKVRVDKVEARRPGPVYGTGTVVPFPLRSR